MPNIMVLQQFAENKWMMFRYAIFVSDTYTNTNSVKATRYKSRNYYYGRVPSI